MTSRAPQRGHVQSFTGWIRWIPVLMLPLSAVFVDTRLNTEKVRKDYTMSELSARIRQQRDTLDVLGARIASQGNMFRIEVEAPDLGLVPPEPNQIRMIYCAQSQPEPEGNHTEYAQAPLPGRATGETAETRVAKAGEPGRTEPRDTSWDSDPQGSRARMKGMIDRVRQTLASAYASYFGHS